MESVNLAPSASGRGAASPARRGHRRTVVLVAVLSLVIVGAFIPRYLPMDPSAARVGIRADLSWHFPVLLVHIFTATILLLLGPSQFSGTLRRRAPRVHRTLGRTYLIALIPASLSGLVVAVLSTAGPVANAGFVLLDIGWIITGVQGYRTVRARRYHAHERWMMRNFALTFAAVTLRFWLGILIAVQLPLLHSVYGGNFASLFNPVYLTVTWLSWVPNLLFIEWYLRRHGTRRP